MQLIGEIAYVLTARPFVFLACCPDRYRGHITKQNHVWVEMTRNRLFALYTCLFELNDFIETYALGLILQ